MCGAKEIDRYRERKGEEKDRERAEKKRKERRGEEEGGGKKKRRKKTEEEKREKMYLEAENGMKDTIWVRGMEDVKKRQRKEIKEKVADQTKQGGGWVSENRAGRGAESHSY